MFFLFAVIKNEADNVQAQGFLMGGWFVLCCCHCLFMILIFKTVFGPRYPGTRSVGKANWPQAQRSSCLCLWGTGIKGPVKYTFLGVWIFSFLLNVYLEVELLDYVLTHA